MHRFRLSLIASILLASACAAGYSPVAGEDKPQASSQAAVNTAAPASLRSPA
jgi:hypothetical protein